MNADTLSRHVRKGIAEAKKKGFKIKRNIWGVRYNVEAQRFEQTRKGGCLCALGAYLVTSNPRVSKAALSLYSEGYGKYIEPKDYEDFGEIVADALDVNVENVTNFIYGFDSDEDVSKACTGFAHAGMRIRDAFLK